MRTFIITFAFFTISGFVKAQDKNEKEIRARLITLGLPTNFLDQTDDKINYNFSCTYKSETSSENTVPEVKEMEYTYNPQLNTNHYNLISVNKNKPTETDLNQFNKDHNGNGNTSMGKADPSSLIIVKENDSLMVVGFKYLKKSLPHKYKFLKDCKGEFYIDKKTKHLKEIKFYNVGPLKYKIFKISKLYITQKMIFMEETQTYVISEESTLIDIKAFGQIIQSNEFVKYHDYVKVN